ncbi:hypothetical protein ACPJHQ_16670 [Rossellomorea sp. H39__3]
MAFLVGSLIVLGSGIQGLMLLFLFFITSSLFSAFRKRRRREWKKSWPSRQPGLGAGSGKRWGPGNLCHPSPLDR